MIEAPALEEEDVPLIEPLEGLSQLAEAVAKMPVSYKESKGNKSSKLVKCVISMNRLDLQEMSVFGQVCIWIYTIILIAKKSADNKWINWENIKHSPEMLYVEKNVTTLVFMD